MSNILIDPKRRSEALRRDGLIKDKTSQDREVIKLGNEILKMSKYGESKERIRQELTKDANRIVYGKR